MPEKFSAIKMILAEDGKLYVQTYKKENGRTEFFAFNRLGKPEKEVMLPLREINAIEYYPYYIKHSKLFQLVENEDEEEWILYITEI